MKSVVSKQLMSYVALAIVFFVGCDNVISKPEQGRARPKDVGGIEIGGSIEKLNSGFTLTKIDTVRKQVSQHVSVTEDVMAYKSKTVFPRQIGSLKDVEIFATPVTKRIYKIKAEYYASGKMSEKSKEFEDILELLRKEFKVKDGESDGFFGAKKHTFKMADVDIILEFIANSGNISLVATDTSLEANVKRESSTLPVNKERWAVLKENKN